MGDKVIIRGADSKDGIAKLTGVRPIYKQKNNATLHSAGMGDKEKLSHIRTRRYLSTHLKGHQVNFSY